MSLYRLDYQDASLELRSMTIDPSTGFAKITGVVATPGVLEYPELGFNERVSAETLSDPESIESLRGAPLVRLHPDVETEGGRVHIENVRWLAAGTVISVRWDPATEELLFEAVVTDADTVAALIEAKETNGAPNTLADCSPGYDVLEKRGDEQIKRKYNHLALVPYGRGSDARIYLDAAPTPEPTEEVDVTPEEIRAMLAEMMTEMREDMRTQLDGYMAEMRKDMVPPEEPPTADEMQAEEARMDALVTARAEQRRVVADVATKAGVEWNKDASVYANMRAVLETKIPKAYRADATDEAVVGMFEVYAASLESDAAPATRNDGFDGYHAFAFQPGAEQRNDAAPDVDPIQETLNELAAARARR